MWSRGEQKSPTRPEPEKSESMLGDAGGLYWVSGTKTAKFS
jgi:hypothetical protein